MKTVVVRMLVLVVCAGSTVSAQEIEGRYSDAEWREDLAEFVDFAKKTHINLYHAVGEQDFETAVQQLHDDIPRLSDQGIAMEFVALAARIGDGHSWIGFGENLGLRLLPVRFYEFDDGIFVTHGIRGNEGYVGGRLLSIGGQSVSELLPRTHRYCSRDNEWGVLNSRAGWLGNEAFLLHEGIVSVGQDVALHLQLPSGETVKAELSPVPVNELFSELRAGTEDSKSQLPLYREQREGAAYWMEYLRKDKTVYMKFNEVRNSERGPRLGEFANLLIDEVRKRKARKLIVDVRHNSGGDGNLTRKLIRSIAKCDQINQEGRLFVITGRRTFSAALMFTARMEKATHAQFAGEPGRGKPNSYSEFNGFTLGNTGMSGSISSLFHEEGEPDDAREYIDVDISVPLGSDDYFANRDPVLEEILRR